MRAASIPTKETGEELKRRYAMISSDIEARRTAGPEQPSEIAQLYRVGHRLRFVSSSGFEGKTVWEVCEIQKYGLVIHTINNGASSHKHLAYWYDVNRSERV